ncbi:hypothetical protein [Bacillus benzoevorans]|uniref:Uncharacterized protein n=1 Tax=Bacillus benzoevorans TaxID=1456 RepID=A0A7X0LWE9_9BACI|nr:hypothetical protein [Bacillus benzoevorans]
MKSNISTADSKIMKIQQRRREITIAVRKLNIEGMNGLGQD